MPTQQKCLLVEEALAGKSVHEGWDCDPASAVVGVGLPLREALLDGCPLLPAPHFPGFARPAGVILADIWQIVHEALPLPA